VPKVVIKPKEPTIEGLSCPVQLRGCPASIFSASLQLCVVKHLELCSMKKVELEANSTFFWSTSRGTSVFRVLYSHVEL
jgi:hypothetical protein